ncbi:MAG TPA: hypothetical protein HA355_00900 [Methanosphaera sp.]|nr:hypothetical protein [Methanosphaera sp.]HII08129.1 hypothetical protein [Methanosphaera sp.]
MLNDDSGQISMELILLMACIIMVVICSISFYMDYLENFVSEINNTEVNQLKYKIDKINNLIK